jgi:hypothetical protein
MWKFNDKLDVVVNYWLIDKMLFWLVFVNLFIKQFMINKNV